MKTQEKEAKKWTNTTPYDLYNLKPRKMYNNNFTTFYKKIPFFMRNGTENGVSILLGFCFICCGCSLCPQIHTCATWTKCCVPLSYLCLGLLAILRLILCGTRYVLQWEGSFSLQITAKWPSSFYCLLLSTNQVVFYGSEQQKLLLNVIHILVLLPLSVGIHLSRSFFFSQCHNSFFIQKPYARAHVRTVSVR